MSIKLPTSDIFIISVSIYAFIRAHSRIKAGLQGYKIGYLLAMFGTKYMAPISLTHLRAWRVAAVRS